MDQFLELHKSQLELSGIPQYFWDTLYEKLQGPTFDAGNMFTLIEIDYNGDERGDYDPPYNLQVKSEDGMKALDPKHIYLVDHAWTFRIENARRQLRYIDSLRERMANMLGLNCDLESDELAEKIFNKLWKYCDCYWTASADNVEDRIAVWYTMDEVGSAIQHSETPNFRVVPFIYIPEQITYSLIFPIKDLDCGDVITRNFVERLTEDCNERLALTLPWIPHSFLDMDYVNEEPSPDYFLSGHIQESLPILSKLQVARENKEKYKVFAEYDLVHQYLTEKSFEIVENEEEADILWYTTHFKNFEELCETPSKFINQFPFEYVLTIKDLLSIVCRRKSSKNCDVSVCSPTWLPTTYNLKTELPKFVSYYQHREKKELDNHWIIKPFNLARGLDTHITSNLNYIVRLPITGPKIAQKYIDKPLLFYREDCSGKVKFDIRYVLLLKNVKPIQAYVYKNFFLRFANQPFEMNNFDEYTKHFTVMNYIDGAKDLKHMLCDDFKNQWEKQYPDISWHSVEEKIFKMLKEVLECATMESPPCGISESPQSRALYATDIMLEWNDNKEVQPKLLEINWTPDCKRACEYYPNFFNDIFKLLFLDVDNSDVFYNL